MSANDIMHWDGPFDVRTFLINDGTTESFRVGEPVSINTAGELTESADDPTAVDLIGIALGPAGYSIGGTATTKNTRTGAAFTGLDMVPVLIARDGTRFITKNYSAAGSAFADTAPTRAEIGDEVGLSLISNVWGIDNATSNITARIVDVLDAQKCSLMDPLYRGNTGVYVVFEIVTNQSRVVTAPAA